MADTAPGIDPGASRRKRFLLAIHAGQRRTEHSSTTNSTHFLSGYYLIKFINKRFVLLRFW